MVNIAMLTFIQFIEEIAKKDLMIPPADVLKGRIFYDTCVLVHSIHFFGGCFRNRSEKRLSSIPIL